METTVTVTIRPRELNREACLPAADRHQGPKLRSNARAWSRSSRSFLIFEGGRVWTHSARTTGSRPIRQTLSFVGLPASCAAGRAPREILHLDVSVTR